MGRRTEMQLALLIVGLIAWGYGERVDDARLRYVGIGFFAAAFLLRIFKRKDASQS